MVNIGVCWLLHYRVICNFFLKVLLMAPFSFQARYSFAWVGTFHEKSNSGRWGYGPISCKTTDFE